MTIESALQYWGIEGPVSRLGEGHINDTYLASDRYVVQRVNETVFLSADALMRNIFRVASAIEDIAVLPLQIPGRANGWRDAAGDYWRIYPFIEGRSFSQLPDELVSSASRTFGEFLTRANSCDAKLEPAIRGFHDIHYYLREYDAVPESIEAEEEQEFVAEYRLDVLDLSGVKQIIHGDCKVNNLLFHPDEPKVLRIVDLDTLMEGHPALDFGDLLRSVCTGYPSDRWSAVQRRVLDATRAFFSFPVLADLGPENATTFARAPAHMSFMLGLRFLTDHLSGDGYFRVSYRSENLQRAREQFRVFRVFREGEEAIAEAIEAAMANRNTAE